MAHQSEHEYAAIETQDLYDEFGNYIGPDLEEDSNSDEMEDDWGSEDDSGDNDDRAEGEEKPEEMVTTQIEEESVNQIVLHEDKQIYPSAEEVYQGAETMVQDEDAQPLETPIIAPVKNQCFFLIEKSRPTTSFSYRYLASLMSMPHLMRNLCFVGHLHHGKTSFMDVLTYETHPSKKNLKKQMRYTDVRKDEQARGLSIQSCPMTLVMQNLKGKSYLLNMMDCPGHVNFSDEMTAAMRLSDGVCIVVDAVEGVMLGTERAIKHAASKGLPMVLLVNKVDRLIIELRLPPKDAYHKLRQTINEVNRVLERTPSKIRMNPILRNVCFSSAKFGWSFTLASFAKLYSQETDMNSGMFEKRLWGDAYLWSDRRIRKRPEVQENKRTFVEFILEPLYKIYSHVLGQNPEELHPLLNELGIWLKPKKLQQDPAPLLATICSEFFGNSTGFVEMVVEKIPSPMDGASEKVKRNYMGDLNTPCGKGMLTCDSRGVPMLNIAKQYPRPDGKAFDSFGRVFSGSFKIGDKVRVQREGYSQDDFEDMSIKQITDIWIYQGRYRVSVDKVKSGNWALFGGLDEGITKTATVTLVSEETASIFRPLQFDTISTVKVAIEPIKAAELPKMVDGLRCVNKSYPLSITKVEESGEHIVIGPGELYLDCVLHDLRKMYSEIEVKCSDPTVAFCETVDELTTIPPSASSPNDKNKLTMLCSTLDKGLAEDIENEKVRIDWEPKKLGQFFQDSYSWDILASRSIWAFGPSASGPNVLRNDCLETEVPIRRLNLIRNSVVQGFQWGTREGPLCDEPIRNCCFRLIKAEIAEKPLDRGGGQIIPTSRRVLYSSFLLSSPRLMEPHFFVEIQCPADCISAIYRVLKKRRGHVMAEVPKPGTPFYILNAVIPAIDSFGFETDLRMHTMGQAMCLQCFDHWEIVPGDPMDSSLVLVPLEPSPPASLAREFMIKTRKRKGLSEDVSIEKFFDQEMLEEFARQEAENLFEE